MTVNRADNKFKQTIKYWRHISPEIRQPLTDKDYNRLSKHLDRLLDIVGDDEEHELIGLVDIISYMISIYDEKQNKLTAISGIKALKFLMEQYGLHQNDLPEIGSQGIVSEILSGKRKLNLNQIKKLAKRFKVSVETFID